jgi:hypothetical protein
MDFRKISVRKLHWKKISNKSATLLKKSVVQVPRLKYRISRENTCVSLEPISPFPYEFREFMDSVADCARNALKIDAMTYRYCCPLRRFVTYDDDDACWFDGDATHSKVISHPDVSEMSLLLRIDGAWFSGTAWGLRLKVLQLKTHHPTAPK